VQVYEQSYDENLRITRYRRSACACTRVRIYMENTQVREKFQRSFSRESFNFFALWKYQARYQVRRQRCDESSSVFCKNVLFVVVKTAFVCLAIREDNSMHSTRVIAILENERIYLTSKLSYELISYFPFQASMISSTRNRQAQSAAR